MDMTTDQTMQLFYLALLGGALVWSLALSGGQRFGRMLQQLLSWALIFIGVIAAYGLWETVGPEVAGTAQVATGERVELRQDFTGHYHATLEVGGTPIRFIVDTGATQVVLTQQDAARLGIDPAALRYDGVAFTANGRVATAEIRIPEMSLGPITDRNVPAVVTAGEMEGSLLGMTYLGLYDRIEISDGRMVLIR